MNDEECNIKGFFPHCSLMHLSYLDHWVECFDKLGFNCNGFDVLVLLPMLDVPQLIH